jgi:tRNA nucleotidyltransferase (CCA-adding enzyme)
MSDYNFLMESRLSPEQFSVINHLSRIAAEQGLNLYLVGGAVRDLTYGLQAVRDLDFAVEGNPQKIIRHLPMEKSGRLARGGTTAGAPSDIQIRQMHADARLNSVEMTFSNGVRAEIGMCRVETYLRPDRRPEISPATIFEDLRRRDLSMNAMAISLHPNSRGLLLDPTNGVADIERHELRALYRSSFSDDPSRIYRLLRLGLRLDFKPEERTQAWLNSALANHVTTLMSVEQRGRELRAILEEENPSRVLKLLQERGLLTDLDRKLAGSKIPYERLNAIRTKAAGFSAQDVFLINFCCLTEKLGAGDRVRLAKQIIPDARIAKLALTVEHDAKKLANTLGSSKALRPSQIYTLLSAQPPHLLLFLLTYYPQARIQSRLKSYLVKFPQVRAKLPRADFFALGVKPGPEAEKILERVFLEQLDGKVRTPSQTTKRLKELAGIKDEPPKAPPAKTRRHKAKGK